MASDKHIKELEQQIASLTQLAKEHGLDVHTEVQVLQQKLTRMKEETYLNLTAMERVQLARHPKRPYTSDYIELAFTDFIELHGDRSFRDDEAIIGGWAKGTVGSTPVTRQVRY
jgi:acetyl-CoA carboxylase carboxyl transferase subunit alpha